MPTFFKELQPSEKVQRTLRRKARESHEDGEKAKARRRDKGCRFPLCGCGRLGLSREVSHSEHKGAGGNPDRSRSVSSKLVYLCSERHRTNAFSIHNHTIECRPLRASLGMDGPVAWLVDKRLLRYCNGEGQRPARSVCVEVARETAVGVLAPMPESSRAIL